MLRFYANVDAYLTTQRDVSRLRINITNYTINYLVNILKNIIINLYHINDIINYFSNYIINIVSRALLFSLSFPPSL